MTADERLSPDDSPAKSETGSSNHEPKDIRDDACAARIDEETYASSSAAARRGHDVEGSAARVSALRGALVAIQSGAIALRGRRKSACASHAPDLRSPRRVDERD